MTLRSYRRLNGFQVSRGAMVSGHVVGEVAQQQGGQDRALTKFDVPPDKRLLQLGSERLQARSAYGRALSRAVTVVQNYFVQDERGRRYKLAGKYAIANVQGKKVIEIQYFRDPVGTIGGVGQFSQINERNLKPDDTFVLLFLVDPGARIVSFSTGGSAARSDDLKGKNLVAPP